MQKEIMKFKASNYNHLIKLDGTHYIFNALLESYFSVPSQRLDLYLDIINNPNNYTGEYDSFLRKMQAGGYILDYETDELSLVKQKYHAKRRKDEYFLMVLPTYQCNLRCWYCIQKHQNSWLSTEVVAGIKKRIEIKASDSKIRNIRLSWFGGEPLLNYEVLVDILNFAKKTADINQKEFSSDVTTNATLLSAERIEHLKGLGVSSYQITIDGTREKHNNVKQLKEKSAFDIALINIKAISQHSLCTLRINYTKETLEMANEMLENIESVLSDSNKDNIRIMLCKVWQEDSCNIESSLLNSLFVKIKRLGYSVSQSTTGMCYADQYGFECLLPDGSVGFCDNEDFEDMAGKLISDGSIEWNDKKKLYESKLFSTVQNECNQCNVLPICWGPCARRRANILKSQSNINCNKTIIEKELIPIQHLKSLLIEWT